MHIRQPVLASLELERQSLMIDTQSIQYRCLEIMDMHPILGNVIAEFIRLSMRHAPSNSTTCHPGAEIAGVMITPMGLLVIHISLAENGPAKLTAPDHQRVIQQTSLLEVLDECGTRLIRVATLDRQLRRNITCLLYTSPSPRDA